MFRRVGPAILILLCAIAIGVALVPRVAPEFVDQPFKPADPDGEAAFERWLVAGPDRASEFQKFETYLRSVGVGDVVPAWQLTRIDGYHAAECVLDPFAVPPDDLWPNIVPALRLVRDEVIPTVGEVEVRSSYRTPEGNSCLRGVSRSRHLTFSALDLVTADRQRGEQLYRKLCAMHAQAGSRSRMGLGAYFDPQRPKLGTGRFHIDGTGYRSWGHSYSAASSPCPNFS
ncbi:D-Ala-D-Ala carboxypeptidase family metallohydrolase [Pontixanthobacter aquaemixtae]|uniref:Peptidase M15A C-terminal domain-containing protein n=1 Tax=Pontixanthobacter aquaemixtae TaxID=1958940 RepID=A0A844ZVJ7_9SPHN|nr:D-Ala-D-Ala carboxypeptidase family metallohydrolase [Pontixanthobacter aquaemixtae]MXO90777.1 hypothetical protein [Pontixanthobacter aquaemixtae]